MDFSKPYSREAYQNFFQNHFLTDNYEITEEELRLEFNPKYLKSAFVIGEDNSLDLKVLEVLHDSESDPRVGLSKDLFRLMSLYGYKRALALLYSSKSRNYRLSLATIDLSLEGTKVKKEYSNPRRYSFFLGPDAKVKTPHNFLITKGRVTDFEDLLSRFSVEVVTKQFYQEIANWYFWALKNLKFPDDAEAEENGRNVATIRLITRLIFIWFMKVRKLVPDELFDEEKLKGILREFDLKNDNYYKAILQNLFFATLNTKQAERRFTSRKKGYRGFSTDFGNHSVYRYEEEFINSEEAIEKYFLPIPFLNGGLFECLDYKSKTKDERKYIDGFTSTRSKQPVVPNYLFFGNDESVDLNKEYGTKSKEYTVRGLIKTLSMYNFTIDENDPNDAEIALDPELLGKVFENLLASYNPETEMTARKSTGSYNTRRPIVDYMVDESLKQYFKTHLEIDDERINKLFSDEEGNPFDVDTTEKLVSLIDSLRAVDPAVGSGAFPMRLLNRLVFLLHKLDPDNQLWKKLQIEGIEKSVKDPILKRKFIEQIEKRFGEKNPDYGRKLYLIEKCIYGVDIQQIAVEIAKLRFFISLLVDEKIDLSRRHENYGIEPLPNLDFKLMQGNSLISSFPGVDLKTQVKKKDDLFTFDDPHKKLIEEFEELKSQYQNEPDVEAKRKLKDDIDKKLREIFEEKLKYHFPQLKEINERAANIKNEAQRKDYIEKEKKDLFKNIKIDLDKAEKDLIAFTEGRKQKNFFLWDVYFAEVYTGKQGFDIVIGNPPYIQLQKAFDKKVKYADLYKEQNYETFDRTGDIYCLFYEKGIELLKQNGLLTYITSNKWMRAGYGEKLREFFTKQNPLRLVDLGPGVFENATVDTNILITQKINNQNQLIAVTLQKEDRENIAKALSEKGVLLNKLTKEAWFIGSDTEQKLKEKIERIGKPLKDWDVKIYRGVLTGLNEAFIITTEKRNEILANCKDINERKRTEAIIKPILRGRDIKRYYYEWAGLWVIFIPWHFPLHEDASIQGVSQKAEKEFQKQYPAIYNHLIQFKDALSKRNEDETGIRYEWYALQRCAATYYPEFEKEKVVYSETIKIYSDGTRNYPRFCYDDSQLFLDKTTFFISGLNKKKYLLGFLNSKVSEYLLESGYSIKLGSDSRGLQKILIEKFPFPPITPSNEALVREIEKLVDKIITEKQRNPNADTSQREKEIDRLVYQLYDFTEEEIEIIERGK